MTEYGSENLVWIAGIDGKRRNLLAVGQAEMNPGLARVGGFVDSVADGKIRTVQSSPVATYTMFGSEGATAIAPMDCVGS